MHQISCLNSGKNKSTLIVRAVINCYLNNTANLAQKGRIITKIFKNFEKNNVVHGKGLLIKKLCMPGLHFDFHKLTAFFFLKNNKNIYFFKSIIGRIGVVFSVCIFSEKTNESECTRAEYYYVLFGIKTCQK